MVAINAGAAWPPSTAGDGVDVHGHHQCRGCQGSTRVVWSLSWSTIGLRMLGGAACLMAFTADGRLVITPNLSKSEFALHTEC